MTAVPSTDFSRESGDKVFKNPLSQHGTCAADEFACLASEAQSGVIAVTMGPIMKRKQ